MAKQTVQTFRDGKLVDEHEIDVPDDVVNRDTLHARVDQAVDQLEDYAGRWATLTAAERTAAMGLAVRVVARVARLVIGRTEAAP